MINLLADSMRTRSRTTVGGAFGGHAGDQGIGIDLGAQGGWVAASEGFALIATRSLRHQRPSREQERSWTFLGEQYWESVQLQPPTEEEVERILLGSCPRLSELSLAVLSAWKAVAAGLESWKQIAGSKRPVGLRELLRSVGPSAFLTCRLMSFPTGGHDGLNHSYPPRVVRPMRCTPTPSCKTKFFSKAPMSSSRPCLRTTLPLPCFFKLRRRLERASAWARNASNTASPAVHQTSCQLPQRRKSHVFYEPVACLFAPDRPLLFHLARSL